ncbi:toll/interleukin-1 receptor domain-containing protein [Alteromonas sp. ASW11-36]|uniref:Toll/interleukin-1 receptor domain-containing protein n=1 Tax=Alteromonas arenosi TaxID=3055817 RepID=A0ABT7SS89_9ALTE|nr:toll/interleukin-1 receptor domain-containing protein [Alteromonas sp. ASW11-36]MDM7859035.1 toll/interleukin-1 receptor domain-containing protein [Alteromonas sp. ASW11-36]
MAIYQAFISYAHADVKLVDKLHHVLENMRVPLFGNSQKRLFPIFRDADELPTSANLADSLNLALANSTYLIVIVSEKSLASSWVAKEVEFFSVHNPQDKLIFVTLDDAYQHQEHRNHIITRLIQQSTTLKYEHTASGMNDLKIEIASIMTGHSQARLKRHLRIGSLLKVFTGILSIGLLLFILFWVAVSTSILFNLKEMISGYKDVEDVSTLEAITQIIAMMVDDQDAESQVSTDSSCQVFSITEVKYQEQVNTTTKYLSRMTAELRTDGTEANDMSPMISYLISEYLRLDECASDDIKASFSDERERMQGLIDETYKLLERHGVAVAGD